MPDPVTFDERLISGSVLRSVWRLSWPIVLLNFVNGAPTLANQLMVGHLLGYEANAAIGVSLQVFLVIVVFISSFFQGMSILIAQYAGMRDSDMVNTIAYQSFLSSLYFLIFFLAPFGYWAAPHLFDLVKASESVKDFGVPFLRVLFIGGAPFFMTYMIVGALQSAGDSRTPLKIGTVTAILSVALCLSLIAGWGPFPTLGATGAAVGTCLAPLPGLCFGIYQVLRGKTPVRIPPRLTLIPDYALVKRITLLGIPTGLQAVVMNVGGALLLRKIGGLQHSAQAQAAYTICYQQLFSLLTWFSFGLRVAASTLMGQNIGAGKPARGRQTTYVISALGTIWSLIISALFILCAERLLALFAITDPDVLHFGVSLLYSLAASAPLFVLAMVLTGALQGAGDTIRPLGIAVLAQIVFLLGACEIMENMGCLTAVRIWWTIVASHALRLFLSHLAFMHTSRKLDRKIAASQGAPSCAA